MRTILEQPHIIFYWCDSGFAFIIYIFAIVMLLQHRRGPVTPLLFLGLFIFPLQFSIWFLHTRMHVMVAAGSTILQVLYLVFLKFCVLLSIILSKK